MNIRISELTLDNVGQWPLALRVGVIAMFSFILIGLGYWLIAKDNFAQYDSLKEQENVLKAEFEQKQQQAANLRSYRNQMVIMEERFGNMLKQLPSQNEMPGLLEDISKTGISSGLTFELFAPMPEVEHDFYIELPIQISVKGTYQQFAIFLSRVAQMNRIVTLHDFVIQPAPAPKDASQAGQPSDLLIMKMTAKIYRYRTQ